MLSRSLFQLRLKCRPQIAGETCSPRKRTPPKKRGLSKGGRERTEYALRPPAHTPNKKLVPSSSAAGDSVAAASPSYSESEELLLASGRLDCTGGCRPLGPSPRAPAPYLCTRLRGAAQDTLPEWAGQVVQWRPWPPLSPVPPGLPGGYLSGTRPQPRPRPLREY